MRNLSLPFRPWVMLRARFTVAGAVALTYLGILSMTSDAEAEDAMHSPGRVDLCVEKAEQPSECSSLAKFEATRSIRSQDDIVRASGWATLKGFARPDDALVRNCAVELTKQALEWRFPGTVETAASSRESSGR